MKCVTKSLKGAMFFSFIALAIFNLSCIAQANTNIRHVYENFSGGEIINLIAVDKLKLLPLLPIGYNIIPASALELGTDDQGIVAIANFRGVGPEVDGKPSGKYKQVAIDILILVAPPAMAAVAGLDIAGANHLYTLAIYSDDARYVASLRDADMPAKFIKNITYITQIGSTNDIEKLLMIVRETRSPLKSLNSALSPPPALGVGAFNAIFWFEGKKGTAVLHFLDQPFYRGNAISKIYTLAGSRWGSLLLSGGLGPCEPDRQTGHPCVMSPSLNLRYPQGTVGQLLLMGQRRVHAEMQ